MVLFINSFLLKSNFVEKQKFAEVGRILVQKYDCNGCHRNAFQFISNSLFYSFMISGFLPFLHVYDERTFQTLFSPFICDVTIIFILSLSSFLSLMMNFITILKLLDQKAKNYDLFIVVFVVFEENILYYSYHRQQQQQQIKRKRNKQPNKTKQKYKERK